VSTLYQVLTVLAVMFWQRCEGFEDLRKTSDVGVQPAGWSEVVGRTATFPRSLSRPQAIFTNEPGYLGGSGAQSLALHAPVSLADRALSRWVGSPCGNDL
jgi:hypothetical protein